MTETVGGVISSKLVVARSSVASIFLVNGLLMGSLAVRMVDIRNGLHVSDGPFGLALLSATVGALLSTRPASQAVTRWGSQPVTWIGAIATPISVALLPVAPNLAWFVGALIAFGVAASFFSVGMNTQAVDVERGYQRSIMARFHAMYSVGGIAGASLGGLAGYVGLSAAQHYLILALICSLVGAVAASPRCLLTATAPSGSTPETPGDTTKPDRSAILKRVLPLGIIVFCFYVAETSIDDWSGIYLRDGLQVSAALIGAGYVAFSLTMALGRMFGDRLINRVGAARAVRVGAAVAGAALIGGVAMNSFPVAAISFALFGAGMCLVAPSVFSATGRVHGVSPERAIAVVNAFGYVGLLAGPAAIGLLSEFFGIRTAMILPGLLAVAVAVAASALRPSLASESADTAGAEHVRSS